MFRVLGRCAALVLFVLLAPITAPAGAETTAAASETRVESAAGDVATHERPSEELLALGREVFTQIAEPQCQLCHALVDAGATGEVGPKLDDLKPDAERVAAAVKHGVGVMPAYGDLLSEQQIEAVSAYVAAVAGNVGTAN